MTSSIFDDLIAEGQAVLLAKKKKKEKKPLEPSEKALLLLVKETVPVFQGRFQITCVVAEYVRRTCGNCNYTELCSVPRVFICEQDIKTPSTRKLRRLHSRDVVNSYIQSGLPVKTEVYTSPAPFCKHCVKEVIDHAQGQTKKARDDENTAVYSDGAVLSDVSDLSRIIRTEATPEDEIRSDLHIHNLSDSSGYQQNPETLSTPESSPGEVQ